MSMVRAGVLNRSVAKRPRQWSANWVGTLVMVLIVTGLVRPAAAIVIDGTYLPDETQANGGENPNWDPGGLLLQAHFEAAIDIWEDLLYHPTMRFEFDYEWDDDIDGLGLSSGGMIEISSNASNQTWFVDSAPWDHSEFGFTNPAPPAPTIQGQTLYRDLTAGQQTAWFPGTSPPAVLEVGYRGNANAVSGSPAQGMSDLLSTIVHEIGHELGITGDENYDIYPHHVGSLAGVQVAADSDSGHLAGDSAASWLMCQGCGIVGVRRLPTATDVLAVAKRNGITEAYLRRVDRISSGSWNSASGWLGGRVPNLLVDATFGPDLFIRHGGTVSLNSDVKLNNLFIAESSGVDTNNHTLTIAGGAITVEGDLTVEANGHAELDRVELNSGGALTMAGGTVKVWEGLNVNLSPAFSLSSVQGYGYVEVALPLVNNSVIRAGGGTLSFGAGGFSPTPLDLDGTESPEIGVVEALLGNLFFNAGLTDDFDGVMKIGQGRTVTMAYDGFWTLGTQGNLWFTTNLPHVVPATLDGSQSSLTMVRGTINVDGRGVIGTLLTFKSDAQVNVNGTSSHLILQRPTVYQGGSYSGDGVIEQRGSATISESTTIATRVYDWDGDEHAPSETRIHAETTFTIDSPNIDLGADVYDGLIVNQGGTLVVNTKEIDKQTGLLVTSPWTLNVGATMALQNAKKPPFPGSKVYGSPINVAGDLIAQGAGNTIYADVTFRNTADVRAFSEADELILDGDVEFQGGSFTGDGTIRQFGNAHYVDFTKISVDTYDWDGDENPAAITSIDPGVTVWIRSDQIDTDGGGYGARTDVQGGTLIVNTGDFEFPNLIFMPWRLDPGGEINLIDAAVLSGSGNNNFPENPGSPMLVAGRINSYGLNTTIFSLTTFESSAEVYVNLGSRLGMWAETIYEGGSYTGNGTLLQQGDALVRQPTTIDVTRLDMDGILAADTTWTLEESLTLNVKRLDQSSDVFRGTLNAVRDATLAVNLTTGGPWESTGTIHVEGTEVIAGSTIPATLVVDGVPVKLNGTVHVADGNTIVFLADASGTPIFSGDGTVVFQGNFSPGNSPAVVRFGGDLVLGPAGSLEIELAGRIPGRQHDQVRVEGELDLSAAGNALLLDWIAGSSLGVKFGGDYVVARYAARVGQFDSVGGGDDPYSIGEAYVAGIDYGSGTDDQITVSLFDLLDADANLDGDVDFGDYLILEAAFGGSGGWKDGDFNLDGRVDFGDYLMLEAAFGDSVLAEAAAIPEPATLVMLLGVGVAGAFGLARRRRR